MAYTSLKFRPGIVSDVTSYSNEGGYVDGDKIRFRNGFPEKFGGWVKLTENTYEGSARRLHNWVALDGSDFLGIGTHLKYYIEEGGTFNDITPEKDPTSAGEVTFSATNGSTTITVTDNAHGANVNDFVTFSGVDSNGLGSGGNITQAILQAEFQIVSIISSNSYTITSSVAANSSDTGNGGSSVVGTYQINTGLDATVGGTGWGAGQWSGTTDGAAATTINEGGTFTNSDTTLRVANSNPTHQIAIGDIILIEKELLFVTGVSSNDLTVVRGHTGLNANTDPVGTSSSTQDTNSFSVAAAHADGTLVRLVKGNATATDDFVGWSKASSIRTPGAEIRTWSHDNFGEDLILNPRDGAIYYWDKSNGLSNRAVELKDAFVSGRTSIPQIAKQVLVSDQDRHVIAFGCDGLGASSTATEGNGTQDPLLIRFSSQENPVDWFPTATNTAGDLRLGGGSTFVQAVETKQQLLVFTNKTLHSMKFIGPPFTFGLQELSKNITIMSPASAVPVDDLVFWMGVDTFYIYAGGTQQLPCPVKDKVFLDFNFDERDKVHVGVNSEFSEIIWFYPKAGSSTVNAYVVYNYEGKVWYYGTLSRDAWIDRGIRTFPIATGNSLLYNHELTNDDDGSPMTSFIESGPMDMGDGDKFVSIKQMLPDVSFNGSDNPTPSVSFTLKAKNSAGGNFLQTESNDATRSTTTPIEQFTDKINYRVRGRSFAIKLESTGSGVKYKLGTPRVDMRPDGRR